jgi:hypothetical protein
MQHDQTDVATYIKHNGREWIVWLNEKFELISIPGDELPASENDLLALAHYLEAEGFYPGYHSLINSEE